MKFSVVTVFVCCICVYSGAKEAHAIDLSLTVVPTEVRRQGINQQHPCAQDNVSLMCVLNGTSTSAVRWNANGFPLYTLLVPADEGMTQATATGVAATLVNRTLSTLDIDLVRAIVDPDNNVANETVIVCEEVGDVTISQNETLIVIGTSSSPTVAVRRNSLSSLSIDMIAPVYGRECVDTYRATAVVGDMLLDPERQDVMDPTQLMYNLVFPRVDLCRHMLTNVTAVGITDGMEGDPAIPVTSDNIDRSTIITSEVMVSQIFTSSGVTFVLTWQVVDEGIVSSGFDIACYVENTPTNCDLRGNSVTQRTVVIPYDVNLEGRNVTFSVNYSYEMCMNSPVTSSLIVASVFTRPPVVVAEERAIEVNFDSSLLDDSADRVMFSSNCTGSTAEAYSPTVRISIPDALPGVNSGQCRYTIQLVDTSSQPIGYSITGFFNITGLPPPSMPPPQSNAAAIGGGVGGAAAAGAAGTTVVVIVVVVVIKKKKDPNEPSDGGDTVEMGKTDTDGTKSSLIEHEKAPDGEEYAVVASKPPKKGLVQDTLYQDPNTIQHEVAPGTGDVYAVTEKKTKEPKPRVDDMYSIPDKSKKTRNQEQPSGEYTYANM